MLLQGAVVQINLHSVHNEKSYWGDPEVFRPERHFNAEGKVEKTDHFIPFAIGITIIHIVMSDLMYQLSDLFYKVNECALAKHWLGIHISSSPQLW